MIVLINAISIKEGGSLVVLCNLLSHMVEMDDSIQWHVAAHVSIADRDIFSHHRVTGHFYSNSERTPLHVLWWYNMTLPELAKKIGADLLFSQTNYLPFRQLACPTLLLEQHAGHFSEVYDQRMQASLSVVGRRIWRTKGSWINHSLRLASAVTVQTAALADQISRVANIERGSISVIPHGSGLARSTSLPRHCPEAKAWHIGYITKFGVQKNFEVLLDAARHIKHIGPVAFKLHLTLNSNLPECAQVLSLIEEKGISDVVINHGELDAQGVRDLYGELDLFVFPSLCESFGFPMLEAMAYALPMLVADVPGNREIAGPDAPFFKYDDADALAQEIMKITQPLQYEALSKAMSERSEHYSWEAAARDTLHLVRKVSGCPLKESMV